jgi:glutamate 5-kinase
MTSRDTLLTTKRVVIKIGSALLTNDGKGLDKAAMADWVTQVALLHKSGIEVVLVSSGAVAEGMKRLGWSKRPDSLHELQAAAAVGQMGLVQAYEAEFQRYQLHTAQILLVHDDLSNRKRYLNARNTLQTIIHLGVIPIVNENDTVATDEIRFGDNDTLGAVVANTIDADLLIILTDQDGMYDADPRKNATAKLISDVKAGSEHLLAMASGGGVLGRGGMTTKVRAAELAARSGTDTIIVGGRIKDVITRVMRGEQLGTLLYSDQKPLEARKLWLAGLMKSKGTLVLDDGAVTALKKGGVSLLPIGVKEVQGSFVEGDMVICVTTAGQEIAKGLINYPLSDVLKIKGMASSQLAITLGYQAEPELIHCDNLVVF